MAEIQLQGMPVWVYAKNIDDNRVVAPARLIDGVMGEPYQIEPVNIDGYQFVKANGELSGVLDEGMHAVTLYYRSKAYLEAQPLEDKYLHLKKAVSVYDDAGIDTSTAKLWPGMVVKVVQRIATKDGAFWYQMPDSRWVRFDMHDMTLTSDDGQVTNSDGGWLIQPVWKPENYQAQAMIDFVPGQALNVYEQPYGQVIGTVNDQAKVQIVEQVADDADNVWYHLDQLGWVSSIYVDIV